ncbi:MAG: YlxM family DNA-binding protein [Oscillospiraceae bacterium]|nr:YlxM family DNA-binding protein [Oscillospiraceae bacterium]
MEKNLEISLLFDFYGQLLKEQQQKAISLYYNDDLSLSEIAYELNITRQGVRDSIKRGESQLYTYEEKLGLFERFRKTQSALLSIENLAEKLTENYDKSLAEEIIATAKSLRE